MSIGRRYIGHGAGYLVNDNTASGHGKQEADVVLCPHCQKVIELSKWRAADGGNGWCMKCASPICGPCANRLLTEGCKPFMAEIEKMLQRDYARAQFRKVAGLEPPEQPTLSYRGPPQT